jgi:hypothetical protein
MDVSEHLQRELVYSLNAVLLRHLPPDPRSDVVRETEALSEALSDALVAVMRREGVRVHEPDLLARWAEAAGTDADDLVFQLQDATAVITDELEDDEEPWSAHRLLDLLAREPFWALNWTAPGEQVAVPLRVAQGIPLPLKMRAGMVRILDAMELTLFEANQDQRSVHDGVSTALFESAIDTAMAAIGVLGRSFARRGGPPDLPTALVRASDVRDLPSLRTALASIQRWKLSVWFDAAPDDDDGEWTMRVLERLYTIEWVR